MTEIYVNKWIVYPHSPLPLWYAIMGIHVLSVRRGHPFSVGKVNIVHVLPYNGMDLFRRMKKSRMLFAFSLWRLFSCSNLSWSSPFLKTLCSSSYIGLIRTTWFHWTMQVLFVVRVIFLSYWGLWPNWCIVVAVDCDIGPVDNDMNLN